MLLQTKPHGGIFFTNYQENDDTIELGYTVIDNELTLYDIYGLPGEANVTSTDMEIQRR